MDSKVQYLNQSKYVCELIRTKMPTIYFDVKKEGNKTNIKIENSFIFHNPSFWDFEPFYYFT